MIWLRILGLAVLFGSLVKGQQTCAGFSVGITNPNIIPDLSFSASSELLTDDTRASYGRLNENRGRGAWCARPPFENESLEVDLGRNFAICGIRVQGGYLGSVTKFRVGFSTDRRTFTILAREFTRPGVAQQEESVFFGISPFQVGRSIRILPTDYNEWICLRFELYGFPAPKITCNRDFMLVEFDKNSYIDLEGSNMHLRDESCVASSENATHISFRIPFNGCGTERFTRDDDFLYLNEVIRKIDASAGIVTRQMDLAFPVECFIDRDYAIGGVNYTIETTASNITATESPTDSRGGRVYNHLFSWVLGLPAVWLCLLGVVG